MNGWAMIQEGIRTHHVPIGDLIDHDVNEWCVCRPRRFAYKHPILPMGVSEFTHHALDGRVKEEV